MRLKDKYLVLIEERHIKEFKHGSLVLDRPALTDRYESSDGKTSSYIPEQHLTRSGVISSLPSGLSKTAARLLNPGHPQPSRHVSGEMIEKSGDALRKEDYNPSTYTDDIVTVDQLYSIEAKVGDIAHFYHTAIDKNDPIGEKEYAVNVSEVFAIERNGVLMACKGYVICRRVAKATSSSRGLEIVHSKGKGDHLDRGMAEITYHASEISKGETVFHKKNADYAIELLGEHLFVVREYDCLSAMAL